MSAPGAVSTGKFTAGPDTYVAAEDLGTILEPGHGVPHAVDDGEGGRGLGGIALVTEGDIATLGKPAHALVPGL
ncbi:hypothetical protein C6A85_12705, partial [Mycobacterium sp. ITM-2017-0098]